MLRSMFIDGVFVALSTLVAATASAAEVDPCACFTWDVSHELAVMKQSPQAMAAAVKPAWRASR